MSEGCRSFHWVPSGLSLSSPQAPAVLAPRRNSASRARGSAAFKRWRQFKDQRLTGLSGATCGLRLKTTFWKQLWDYQRLFSSRLWPKALLRRIFFKQRAGGTVMFHTCGSVPVCTARIRAVQFTCNPPPGISQFSHPPPIPYLQWLAKAFTPTEPFHILSLYTNKHI